MLIKLTNGKFYNDLSDFFELKPSLDTTKKIDKIEINNIFGNILNSKLNAILVLKQHNEEVIKHCCDKYISSQNFISDILGSDYKMIHRESVLGVKGEFYVFIISDYKDIINLNDCLLNLFELDRSDFVIYTTLEENE